MKTILQLLATALFLSELSVMAPRAHAQGGVPLWTNRYDGPGNGDDVARGIVLDANGNVFVTGSASDFRGYDDYATIKYSSTGVPLWTNYYIGPGTGDEVATGIAVDGSGDVVVTGRSRSTSFGSDYATIKYSSAGVPLWTNRFRGEGNSQAKAVAVDSNGNVFVTGLVVLTNGFWDYCTVAFSSAGAPLWTNYYDGPSGYSDSPVAIAVDRDGNVIVTGYSYNKITIPFNVLHDADYATIKYSSAGVPLWTNRYNGPGTNDDVPNVLVVDSSGSVLLTGSSWGTTSSDCATITYSSAGVALWTNRYDEPGNNSEVGTAMVVDSGGNVFVTGASYGSGASSDYVTIKYSSAGKPLWTNRYHGSGNGYNIGRAVALDSNGSVFVSGYSTGIGSGQDWATLAYSSAGLPLWTNRYDGPAHTYDDVISIAVDSGGCLFVSGYSNGNGSGYDYTTIKYSATVLPVHLALNPDGSGGFFIRFTGASDVTYRLQRATNVTGPWGTLATLTAPASGLLEFQDTTPLPGQAFYRTVQP